MDSKNTNDRKSTHSYGGQTEKRLSKHSSMTSEVDIVIAETSISEAKIENVSQETFVVLEPGNTVKLTKNPEKDKCQKGEEFCPKCPDRSESKPAENATKLDENANKESSLEKDTKHTDENKQLCLIDPKLKNNESSNNAAVDIGQEKSDNDSKKVTNLQIVKYEGNKEQIIKKEENMADMQNSKEISDADQIRERNDATNDTPNDGNEDNEKNENNTGDQNITTNLAEPELTEFHSPETVALVAKQLTTALAKQMVDATTKLGREMIGAANDTLAVFNGSTLELADVDYFVIYKADNSSTVDGIRFVARLELGTTAILKIIPITPTRAWVAYFGGGIKLIDTVQETTLNKIEVPGLNAIATTDENYLFSSSCLMYACIDKMHIVGQGAVGTNPFVKQKKSLIACMSMTKSGKHILVCLQKENSFLCFPGKSEFVVQVYSMRGKRSKELRPKKGRAKAPILGRPVGLCENINGDICISTFNNADHTCSVEIYDKDLDQKFSYKGDKNLSPRFMCEDLCTDNKGNILMLDSSLKSVHIINKDGAFIKLISTAKYQIENPKCINVDQAGQLWIGQGPPAQIVVLHYDASEIPPS